MSHSRTFLLGLLTVLSLVLSAQAVLAQYPNGRPGGISRSPSGLGNFSSSAGEHNKRDDCPPGSERPPQNCDDVRRLAYQLARRKGYQMSGGIPTVMTRPYVENWNDCSTGNAHIACMFNDECTAPAGELLGLRSRSAYHATTLYRGADGREFECDFTPGSSGIFIRNKFDTRVGPAFPDPGESIDPAYDCEKNGASSTALNPGMFGGGGGPLQNMAIIGAITELLKGGQEQKNPGNSAPGGSNPPGSSKGDVGNVIVLPTATPTKTPTPTPVPSRGPGTSTAGDAGIVSSSDGLFGMVTPTPSKGSAERAGGAELGTKTWRSLDAQGSATWEEKRGSMFD